MAESAPATLSPYTASDGENLAVQDWPVQGGATRGTVLLVHGLGEHAGRYDALARRLNGWGFAVRGYDQFGHGESAGPRGGLTSGTRLLDDLADLVDATRARLPACPPASAWCCWATAWAGWWRRASWRNRQRMGGRGSMRWCCRPPRSMPA